MNFGEHFNELQWREFVVGGIGRHVEASCGRNRELCRIEHHVLGRAGIHM